MLWILIVSVNEENKTGDKHMEDKMKGESAFKYISLWPLIFGLALASKIVRRAMKIRSRTSIVRLRKQMPTRRAYLFQNFDSCDNGGCTVRAMRGSTEPAPKKAMAVLRSKRRLCTCNYGLHSTISKWHDTRTCNHRGGNFLYSSTHGGTST